MSPVLYSREATVEKVVRKIHKLGEHGVQFVTFPETVVPYYPYFSFVQAPFQKARDCAVSGIFRDLTGQTLRRLSRPDT